MVAIECQITSTGSEMIGAGLAGWEEVVGIDTSEEYCEIARVRLAHWLDGGSDDRPVQLELGGE